MRASSRTVRGVRGGSASGAARHTFEAATWRRARRATRSALGTRRVTRSRRGQESRVGHNAHRTGIESRWASSGARWRPIVYSYMDRLRNRRRSPDVLEPADASLLIARRGTMTLDLDDAREPGVPATPELEVILDFRDSVEADRSPYRRRNLVGRDHRRRTPRSCATSVLVARERGPHLHGSTRCGDSERSQDLVRSRPRASRRTS